MSFIKFIALPNPYHCAVLEHLHHFKGQQSLPLACVSFVFYLCEFVIIKGIMQYKNFCV